MPVVPGIAPDDCTTTISYWPVIGRVMVGGNLERSVAPFPPFPIPLPVPPEPVPAPGPPEPVPAGPADEPGPPAGPVDEPVPLPRSDPAPVPCVLPPERPATVD